MKTKTELKGNATWIYGNIFLGVLAACLLTTKVRKYNTNSNLNLNHCLRKKDTKLINNTHKICNAIFFINSCYVFVEVSLEKTYWQMPGLFETLVITVLADRAAVFLSFSNFTSSAFEAPDVCDPKGQLRHPINGSYCLRLWTQLPLQYKKCTVGPAAAIARDTEMPFFFFCRLLGLILRLQAYHQCSWVFSGICLEEVDKRNQQRGRRRSWSWHYPAICARDFQIVQCWRINRALVFSFIFTRGGQIATESMSGQGRPEEGADCSALSSQMNQRSFCMLDAWVCSLCVCACL